LSLAIGEATVSDAEQLSVHFTDPLVGTRESIPSVVDPLLCEILDREQVSNCVTCLDELAVCSNDFSSFDHVIQLTACLVALRRASRARGIMCSLPRTAFRVSVGNAAFWW
jgi:hypothetical protein